MSWVGWSCPLQKWPRGRNPRLRNQVLLPDVEAIHYSLAEASPPLWCYVERALDRLEPTQRLIVVMAKTFHWSETRIAAYLQAEGDRVSPAEVKSRLRAAYQQLEAALPDDIRAIYLEATDAVGINGVDDPELDELLSPMAL